MKKQSKVDHVIRLPEAGNVLGGLNGHVLTVAYWLVVEKPDRIHFTGKKTNKQVFLVVRGIMYGVTDISTNVQTKIIGKDRGQQDIWGAIFFRARFVIVFVEII